MYMCIYMYTHTHTHTHTNTHTHTLIWFHSRIWSISSRISRSRNKDRYSFTAYVSVVCSFDTHQPKKRKKMRENIFIVEDKYSFPAYVSVVGSLDTHQHQKIIPKDKNSEKTVFFLQDRYSFTAYLSVVCCFGTHSKNKSETIVSFLSRQVCPSPHASPSPAVFAHTQRKEFGENRIKI